MATKCFSELLVWQRAHQLVLDIYRYSETFPRMEVYCLTSQLRKAAISVPANICEGYKKKGKPDKIRFMNIAQGSLEEVRYYLILSNDLGYGSSANLTESVESVSKLLEGYIRGIYANM